MRKSLFTLFVAVALLPANFAAAQSAPHIDKTDGVARLIVEGRPFLSIAGESSNSASGSLAYMESIWTAAPATDSVSAGQVCNMSNCIIIEISVKFRKKITILTFEKND